MVGKSIIRCVLWLYDFSLQENVKKPFCFSHYLFLSSRFVKGVPAFLNGRYIKMVYKRVIKRLDLKAKHPHKSPTPLN